MFGPSWINFYGSSHDFEKWAYMNEGFARGNSFRGRLLVYITCENLEKESIKDEGKVTKLNLNEKKISFGSPSEYLLYATIYDASMIDRTFGGKPVMFEFTIGSCGHETADHGSQNVPVAARSSNVNGSRESLLQQNEDDKYSMHTIGDPLPFTIPLIAQVSPSRMFCHLNFGSEKPCIFLNFYNNDETCRIYNKIMLQKILYKLEDNLLEIGEQIEHDVADHIVLRKNIKTMIDTFIKGCNMFLSRRMKPASSKDKLVLNNKLDRAVADRAEDGIVSKKKSL